MPRKPRLCRTCRALCYGRQCRQCFEANTNRRLSVQKQSRKRWEIKDVQKLI